MTTPRVLLDTNFFLYLLSPSLVGWHERAKAYWKYFLENGYELNLSAVVASELAPKIDLKRLPIMKNLVVIPFNFTDAVVVGQVMGHLQTVGQAKQDAEVSKVQLKDDVKIIAQALQSQVTYLVSGDQQILNRYAMMVGVLNGSGACIDLAHGPSHYFPL